MKITTIYGDMDDADPRLTKRTGSVEDVNERTEWVEYWMDGVLVHRSADVQLKRRDAASANVGRLG
jgi:3-keto-L-gulonate-6-phosphate decarboxylase